MAENRIQRRLAAILSADVVGYSRLMAADEAGTLKRLSALRADLLDPAIAERQGRIVKEMGDGLLVEFASVVDAVECAVAAQRSLAAYEPSIADDKRIRYRMGINLGDVIINGHDIFGDGVNVAARLQALAEPGGITISGTVYDLIQRKLDLGCDTLGEQRLKNIDEPVRVYRVLPFPRQAPDLSQAERDYRSSVKARYADDAAYYVPLAAKTTIAAPVQRATAQRSARRAERRAHIEYHELIAVGENLKQVKVDDLRSTADKYPAIVLLGDPGSGKSTALQALALAYADAPDRVPLLLQLSSFAGGHSLEGFIKQGWGDSPKTGHWGAPVLAANLQTYLERGRLSLLLDELNEMPQEGYRERCQELRAFIDTWSKKGNRFVVACRSLDYGEELSGLQRIEIEPLSAAQIETFLKNELPENWQSLWQTVGNDEGLLAMARNPYVLTVMIDVFEEDGELIQNRATLMQRFTEIMLGWAKSKCPPDNWLDAELQVEALSAMAFEMQVRSGFGTTVKTEQIKALMPRELQLDPNWPAQPTPPDKVLSLAAQANIVEMPVDGMTVRFYHQLLQEYFAARQLLKRDPAELPDLWKGPRLEAEMPAWSRPENNYDPLPLPPSTGWEETTILGAAMAPSGGAFLQALVQINPVLAARCLSNPIGAKPDILGTVTEALLAEIVNPDMALRERIAAGNALAALGDPRPGEMATIPAGNFLMGEGREQHELFLPDYRVGRYPVTNAEYGRFIGAGGYRNKTWWTEAGWLEVGENQDEPRFWRDQRFNKANQPVMGLSWYECVAYCQWLSRERALLFRLPSEAEWEKAARGSEGYLFPWGNTFDPDRLNGRGPRDRQVCTSAPIGTYPTGVSPFGLFDCVGNVWEWCATRWKKTFPYDTSQNEWAPDYLEGQNLRVLRGGSWYDTSEATRCTNRFKFQPYGWNDRGGFRLVSLV